MSMNVSEIYNKWIKENFNKVDHIITWYALFSDENRRTHVIPAYTYKVIYKNAREEDLKTYIIDFLEESYETHKNRNRTLCERHPLECIIGDNEITLTVRGAIIFKGANFGHRDSLYYKIEGQEAHEVELLHYNGMENIS